MQCSFLGLIIGAGLVLAPLAAEARKSNFNENSFGLILGAGSYFMTPDSVDPVPGLAGTGTTTSKSKSFYLVPIKFGIFKNQGPLSLEFYGRYLISLKSDWSTSGTTTGTGSTGYRSLGGGAEVGFAFFRRSRVRALIVANAEAYLQRLALDYSDGTTLDLSSTSSLLGGGLRGELWLGDMWVLSLAGIYQYGLASVWSVDKAKTFMGTAQPAGTLHDADANEVSAKFGGLLAEATLKLNF